MSLYSETPWSMKETPEGLTVRTSEGRRVYRITKHQFPRGNLEKEKAYRIENRRTAIFICFAANASQPDAIWGAAPVADRVQLLYRSNLRAELPGIRWDRLTQEEQSAISATLRHDMDREINRILAGGSWD